MMIQTNDPVGHGTKSDFMAQTGTTKIIWTNTRLQKALLQPQLFEVDNFNLPCPKINIIDNILLYQKRIKFCTTTMVWLFDRICKSSQVNIFSYT